MPIFGPFFLLFFFFSLSLSSSSSSSLASLRLAGIAEAKHASAPSGRSNVVVSDFEGEDARMAGTDRPSQAQSSPEGVVAAVEAEADEGREREEVEEEEERRREGMEEEGEREEDAPDCAKGRLGEVGGIEGVVIRGLGIMPGNRSNCSYFVLNTNLPSILSAILFDNQKGKEMQRAEKINPFCSTTCVGRNAMLGCCFPI